MSALYSQTIFSWIDKNGMPCENMITTQLQDSTGTGTYVSLGAAMRACSNMALVAITRQTVLLLEDTPGDGPYCTAFDRGVLRMKIPATGKSTRLVVPGPREDIFSADHVTVDLTAANILALQDESVAMVGDSLGNAVGPFTRGVRQEASRGIP